MKKSTKFLVESALIAAIYAAATLVIAPIGYGTLQFRISEALTILPVFTPAAIPGLTLGCLISNVISPLGVADMVFGTLASLLGAVGTYLLRNVKVKGFPVLAPLPPIIFNAVIIGVLNTYLGGFSVGAFAIAAGYIALTEAVSCYVLGGAVYFGAKRIFKRYVNE
jgi:hypothetical protein